MNMTQKLMPHRSSGSDALVSHLPRIARAA